MNSDEQTQLDNANQPENLDNSSENLDESTEDTSMQGNENQAEDTNTGTQSDTVTLSENATQPTTTEPLVTEQPIATTVNVNLPETFTATPAVIDTPVVTEATLTAQVNIQPTALVVETPVVEEKGPVELSSFEIYSNKIKESGTAAEKKLVSAIEHYVDVMQPGKPVEVNQGARNQHAFWKTIFNAVELSAQDEFKSLWKILLAYFNQYSKGGAFGYRHVYRFSEFWVNGEEELRAYQKVLNVMALTCDPATRANGMKQFDISRSFDTVFTEVGRSRLIQFYQG